MLVARNLRRASFAVGEEAAFVRDFEIFEGAPPSAAADAVNRCSRTSGGRKSKLRSRTTRN